MINETYYTTEEAARLLSVSEATINRYRKSGALRGIPMTPARGLRPPKRYRYTGADIARFMEALGGKNNTP